MKSVVMTIAWITVLAVAQGYRPKAEFVTELYPVSTTVAPNDSVQASQTVVTFLNWYKKNIPAISRIDLVNQQAGKPYAVNLKNGERYLAYLKSSNLLTDTYLNEWRTYFKERNEGFRITRQNEGPPTGFEYDLVMLNQDVDMQLASLKSLKIDKVTIEKTKATVEFTLFDSYEFRMLRRNNGWIINEILNVSQE